MKASEFKEMDVTALSNELLELRREQFNLRIKHGTKQLAQTHNLKDVRRKIARLKTILHEKLGKAS